MPTQQGLGTNNREGLEDRGKPSVQLDKKPAIGIRQPALPFTLRRKNDQLLSERCALRLEPALGLGW